MELCYVLFRYTSFDRPNILETQQYNNNYPGNFKNVMCLVLFFNLVAEWFPVHLYPHDSFSSQARKYLTFYNIEQYKNHSTITQVQTWTTEKP